MLLLAWLHKTVKLLVKSLKVSSAFSGTQHPSSNPKRKSHVGLNQEIVGGEGAGGGVLNRSSASYPSAGKCSVKTSPDILMVIWGYPVLLICPRLHTSDKRREEWIVESVYTGTL